MVEEEQEGKFVVPIALAIKPRDLKVETASDFCRKVRVHRFLAIAENEIEATEIAHGAILTDEFAEIAGMALEDGKTSIAACALFPKDGEPLGERSPFVHFGCWTDDDMPGGSTVYMTGVSAGSPAMADWLVRDYVHQKTAMRFGESLVLPIEGDHLYLGVANYPEARAIFHRQYSQTALVNPVESLERAVERVRARNIPKESLLECLEPSVRAIMADSYKAGDIARHVIVTTASDMTAAAICKGDDEAKTLWQAVANDWLQGFFQPYTQYVVGCGLSFVSQGDMSAAREANILTA